MLLWEMSISKTQFYGAASLDGFLSTGDDHIDWLLQFGDVASSYPEFIAQVGAIAMGASTYEWLINNHVKPNSRAEQPWPYNQPVWVFTHRKPVKVAGANIRFVCGDVQPVHEEMNDQADGKNIWIAGGGELVGQFWDQDLLDELIVQITPVTLGSGKPLLPRSIQAPPLKLISAQTLGSIFVELRYAVQKTHAHR